MDTSIAKLCSVQGCDDIYAARGFCHKHYEHAKNTGEIKSVRYRKPKHGMAGTPEYKAWHAMVKRCYSSNDRSYRNYGARGVRVCERYRENFLPFYDDMGPRPTGMSIDRRDNDANYSCGKCKECKESGWTAN